MSPESVSRTVRFNTDELKLIDEFLRSNPFFDFSTLTRIAVTEFIKNPSVQIKPVGTKPLAPRVRRQAEGRV